MRSSSVNYGTIDMYEALPPHPAASWEPGNVGTSPLRITVLLDETGRILVHIDTAVTLNLAKQEPPLTVLVDDHDVYNSPTKTISDCADPDHGHPVPWRTAEH
ncbi:hypothetical protein [Frankia sp. KB5]|uniref:hypothetical protein n=1 Tax=Frankia sp. KB5 TaxID=683318 RepID=UPI000A0FABDD|nr:hypothetical protein [Frankia sp. KB5]ORT46609.1 hypothetical protein KBI5_24260 [Frankia sp. KB5]